jgi:hypothetical protein
MTARAALILMAAALAARAQFFGGGGGGGKATFALCIGAPCTIGAQGNPYINLKAGAVKKCFIAAATAPTGADLVIDVKTTANASIFTAPQRLPAGSNGPVALTSFSAAAKLAEGETLTPEIVQTGSNQPGQGVTLACRID